MRLLKINNKTAATVDGKTIGSINDVAAVSGVVSQPTPPGPTVDPVFANNSWATIAQVCESGDFKTYWPDYCTNFCIKEDIGTDSVPRHFRVCDAEGLYNKHVVFEQIELTENRIVWNVTTNTDDDGAYDNYNISDMRTTVLPALLANYSLELQAVITNTTYKVAKNGTASPMVLLDLTDKLFLPAEREIFASRLRSVQEEWDALTRFALYALPENDNDNFRIKYQPSNHVARYYWERSPLSGGTAYVCYVDNDGRSYYGFASGDNRAAPCFAL